MPPEITKVYFFPIPFTAESKRCDGCGVRLRRVVTQRGKVRWIDTEHPDAVVPSPASQLNGRGTHHHCSRQRIA